MALDDVLAAQAAGAVVLDTRGPVEFATGHVAGSLNIGLAGRFAEFAGGMISPDVDIVVIADSGHEEEARIRLGRIGFDRVIGHLDQPERVMADRPDAITRSSRVDVRQMVDAMASIDDLQVVDVRQPGETEGGIIPGAALVPLTRLTAELGSLDPSKPTIVYCAGGFRSSIAASHMISAGFTDVSDLLGGYGAWTEAHATA